MFVDTQFFPSRKVRKSKVNSDTLVLAVKYMIEKHQ